jgi:hypothetical protein
MGARIRILPVTQGSDRKEERMMSGIALLVALVAQAGQAGILPEDRKADWRPGVTVGVPGGIPEGKGRVVDLTKPPYSADPTGAANAQPAIQQAIEKSAENDVLHLPAGTYRLDAGLHFGPRRRLTLRGDGPGKTILRMQAASPGGISVGAGGADWWYADRLRMPLAKGAVRGATVLHLGDTKPLDAYPHGGVGMIAQVAIKNDRALPVITPGHWEYMRSQLTRIVSRTPTSITISPALLFDLPETLSPILRPAGRQAEFIGLEDFSLDASTAAVQFGINLAGGYACWVRNVSVTSVNNYHLSVSDSLQCEVRHSTFAKRRLAGSNGAALLMGTSSACLVEDNIFAEQFPHLEINASSGNVFAYNYCHDSTINGMVGCSINTNHGAHSSFNLYEGNVSQKFQSDGYHGGSSHDTAFRNWFHGTSDKTDKFWICVNLNRFTRNYSILGNVLGAKGPSWLYDNADQGFGYDQHFIYVLGMPNMGNGGFSGTAQLSKGKPWKDWETMLAATPGKGPGPSGFQEIDLDVRATTILKGNYNYKDRGVPASESLGGAVLPKSLYRTEKPAWFGTLAWPPYGPDTTFEKNKIPAQVRFEGSWK